jgi:hypothetical protein
MTIGPPLAVFALAGVCVAVAQSPYESEADFAKYGRNLNDRALLNAKSQVQVFVPTASRTDTTTRYPWKTNIVTTVLWIGEPNGRRSRSKSSWDRNWMQNYGGIDDPRPSARRNYIPVKFVPRQNPFYCALPYNDVAQGNFKPEAPLLIPWFRSAYSEPGRSVCKDRWIAIRKGNRICYAQWEDSGPFRDDHFQYVFQDERPKPNANHGAGLEVSPAVRDYLGLTRTDVTDWQFVEVRDVPPGPWRSFGDNNHFVIAKRQAEQGLRDNVTPSGQGSDASSFATPTPLPSPTLADRPYGQHHATDSEMRHAAAARIERNYHVTLNPTYYSLSKLLDFEGRLSAAARIKHNFGVTYDWWTHSLGQLLAAEASLLARAAIPSNHDDSLAHQRYARQSYAGADEFIDEVSSNGALITLSDGSIWKVSPIDQIGSALWLPVTDVRITAGDDASYPYKMVNKDDGEVANVQLAGTRSGGSTRASGTAMPRRPRPQVDLEDLEAELSELSSDKDSGADSAVITPDAGKSSLRKRITSGNPYDPDSLANPYGAGNPYKPDGLMNPYSEYGGPYSNKSWTNPYATDAPKLYDSSSKYLGRLSANPYDPDSVSNPFGQYGNRFSPDSINNPFGAGNPYNPDPIIVVPEP